MTLRAIVKNYIFFVTLKEKKTTNKEKKLSAFASKTNYCSMQFFSTELLKLNASAQVSPGLLRSPGTGIYRLSYNSIEVLPSSF